MGTDTTADIPEWVRQSQSGDSEAFGRLFDLFYDRIYRYLYFRTYKRDTAEDLASVTFMKALEKLSQFRPERGEFSAWLYRIARNSLFDYFRARRLTLELDENWEIADETDLSRDAETRDLWDRLKPLLAELKPDQQDLIKMRIWDEMSYSEIARVLGKKEAACKMSFSRTLRLLRERFPLEYLLWIGACLQICSREIR